MLYLDASFQTSIAALLCEIFLAINLARVAKKGGQIFPVYGVLPTLCFMAFHASFWMNGLLPQFLAAYIVGTLASVAFLFGSSFITTGCLTMKNGELCIDKDNKAFKFFELLPVQFEGKSLCSISWVAAISIFALPVVMSILAICGVVVTAVVCLWTFQNPLKFFAKLSTFGTWPETTVRRNSKGWWISPTPYLVGGYGLSVLFDYLRSLWFVTSGNAVLAFAVFACVCLSLFAISSWGWNKYSGMAPGEQDKDVEFAMGMVQAEKLQPVRVLLMFNVFWQVFRQKYCPKIKYCSHEEMNEGSD